jgi:hypothetical protein
VSDVDWGRYRKCPVCAAEIGEPCTVLTGYVVDGLGKNPVIVPAAAPHVGRQLRAGAR